MNELEGQGEGVAPAPAHRAADLVIAIGVAGRHVVPHESHRIRDSRGEGDRSQPAHAERDRVVPSQLHRLPSQASSFGDLPCAVGHPSVHLTASVAPRRHAIRRGIIGIEFDSFLEKPQRIIVGVPGCLINLGQAL